MLERNIERIFRQEVKARGGMALKQTSDVGIPDRLVLWPNGRVVWVELKTDKGRLSKVQKVMHDRLRKLGFDVETLYGIEQVREWLENY